LKVHLTILLSALCILGLLLGSTLFLNSFTRRVDELTNTLEQTDSQTRSARLALLHRFWQKNLPFLSAFCNNGDIRKLEELLERLPRTSAEEFPSLLDQFRRGVRELFENERLTVENIF